MINESPMRLVEALKRHDFIVDCYSWREVPQEARGLWSPFDDPFVRISSANNKEIGIRWQTASREHGNASSESQALHEQLSAANLREQARLVVLLDEFYAQRKTPLWTRLVIKDDVGISTLQPQGSQIMRLPENLSERETWLRAVQKEMLAFAEFLDGKSKPD